MTGSGALLVSRSVFRQRLGWLFALALSQAGRNFATGLEP
jgi:hypothetical protein